MHEIFEIIFFLISNRLHSSEDLMNYNTREFLILFLLRHLNRKFIKKKKLISCDYHSITTIDSVNLFVCFSYCISSCLFGFLFKDFSNVLWLHACTLDTAELTRWNAFLIFFKIIIFLFSLSRSHLCSILVLFGDKVL